MIMIIIRIPITSGRITSSNWVGLFALSNSLYKCSGLLVHPKMNPVRTCISLSIFGQGFYYREVQMKEYLEVWNPCSHLHVHLLIFKM